MTRAILLLTVFFGCFIEGGAQSLPANFNLVPNPGFELVPITRYQYIPGSGLSYQATDTSLVNNPSCWVLANKTTLNYLRWNHIGRQARSAGKKRIKLHAAGKCGEPDLSPVL